MISNIISILIFIFLVLFALRILANKPVMLKVPWVRDLRYERVSNFQQFLLLTLATSMIMTGLDLQGLDLSAVRLMIWIVFGIAIIFLSNNPGGLHYKTPFIFYGLFIIWLIIKSIDTPVPEVAVRVFLKYLYPLIVLILFARLVRSEDFILIMLKYLIVSSLIYSLLAHGLVTNYIPFIAFTLFGKALWQVGPFNDYAAVMISVFFAAFWLTNKKIYLLFLLWFLFSAVLMVVRTGLAAGFLSLGIIALVRYKIKVLPFVILAFVGLFMIFNTTNFKNKMFYDPSGVTTETYTSSISNFNQETINSSGRFEMWDWAMRTYYDKRPLDGIGLGNLQAVFYSQKHPYAPIRIIHNDFVQMLCDTGIISLVLYLLFAITGIAYSIKNSLDLRNSIVVRVLAGITVSTFFVIILSMNFDNVVNYSFPAHSLPFAFLGTLIGIKSVPKRNPYQHGVPNYQLNSNPVS